jgi:acyl-CoA hydrolase/GNAT superfamily N-acetyltransferase
MGHFAADWQFRYRDQIVSADAALACVADGQRVFVGSGAGVPQTLVETLAARRDLSDVEVVHLLTLAAAPYTDAALAGHFRANALFIGPNVRQAVAAGRADHTSVFLHEVPGLFRTGRVPLDVALISCAPPDENGWCSLGVSCDVIPAALAAARFVVAEVNERMPRVHGECFVHVRDLHTLVASARPIVEAPPGPLDPAAQRIGRHICSLLEDGCTLQLGIGAIPDGVLCYLDQFRDLGVHSEMFSDGVVALVEKGVITNARKTLHPGKLVCSFVMGTQRLYDFVDDNPLVECRPTEYVNDPFVIAQNDKMTAINAALEIDLTGQVCADSLGATFFSGFGGQVDFIRGAARSAGGRPIIALPSTAQDGTVSRIVPYLKQGAGVVTGRADVRFVVTEYGVADLHGLSARERALALVQIAHPDFRHWLIAEGRARNLIPRDQVAVSAKRYVYPEERETWCPLRDDAARMYVRPLKLTDEPLLRSLLYHLSAEMCHDPFFKMHFPDASERLRKFLEHHYAADLTLVAARDQTPGAEVLGLCHYRRNPGTDFADAAVLVREDWQNRGVGMALLAELIRAAQADGVAGFEATLPAYGLRLVPTLEEQGWSVTTEPHGETFKLRITFPPPAS